MPLFKILGYVSSYSGSVSDPVLKIDILDIEEGKLIFILGASGTGKSTLLETLGLMNKTLVAGEVELKNHQEQIFFSETTFKISTR